jgi:hypothetical protein
MSRRQSSRLNPVPSPATTATNSTANPSPAFSTISSAGHETPPTSDDELPVATEKPSKRQVVEIENSDMESTHTAPKRGVRAPAKQVYVEIKATRGKPKAQVAPNPF